MGDGTYCYQILAVSLSLESVNNIILFWPMGGYILVCLGPGAFYAKCIFCMEMGFKCYLITTASPRYNLG